MEDTAIIRLFQERSQQAIAELSQKYGKLCQSLSRRILNNEEDAKECVNDTWLGVWNSIPPQTPNPLVSYVCRITRKSGNNRSNPEKGSSSPYGHTDSRQNKHGKNCCSCSPFKRSLSLVHVMFWLICIRFLYNVITDFTDCIG